MSELILDALLTFTKPVAESHARSAQSTQQGALLAALQSNLEQLEDRLRAEPKLKEVQVEAEWYGDTQDLTWRFVQECLLLLLSLARAHACLLESFRSDSALPNSRTAEAAPALPPDVLSVAQQKTVGTALQFVVTLGLCPYLDPGVGLALECRSTFGAVVVGTVRRDVAPASSRRLLITLLTLLELSEASSLATLVLTKHLGDIMAGLCQLGYRPRPPEEDADESYPGVSVEERMTCRKALQCLLGKVYQPMAIKELLILQGGPKQASPGLAGREGPRKPLTRAPPWLRRLCGRLLSGRLVQSNGVQSVVRAILEGAGAGAAGGAGAEAAASDWRKCEGVARVLAACPQQSISVESYYSQVCPQVLELLHFRDKLTALQFQRVATSTVLAMGQQQPELARRYLLAPLHAPLARCRGTIEDQDPASVQEWELTLCVEDIYKIYVVGNSPCPALLMSLGDSVPTLFSLYCFTKQNVSHLRAPCQEVLLWYLSHVEPLEAQAALKQLCAAESLTSGVAPGFRFAPGSGGGARVQSKEFISDEDDALYEKVSGEQWRVECLVQLLAEMKDSDLPGDFFLELLKELTSWEAEGEEVDTSAMTLQELERHLSGRDAGRGRRLALLHVLAVMCEGVSHTVLLRRPHQVVEFVLAMLQRVCAGLDCGTEGPVETQSLSMGLGLVATMLTGDKQLSPEDRSFMSCLLGPLELISQRHPEPFVQELASDLRTALATHGAFCPDTVTQAAHQQKPRSDRTSHSTTAEEPSRVLPVPDSSAFCTPTAGERTPGVGQSPGVQSQGSLCEGSRASEALSECLLEACHPDVPTRAVALRTLTRAVQEKDREALQAQEKILALFLENLEHEDSFVYLSAIQGLAVLADSFPEKVLRRLLSEYRAGLPGTSTQRAQTLETRLKVGEVLMRASRAMGDLAPHLGRPLVGAFLRGTRDEDSGVRASSLSNLGELCQRLHFSLGPWAQELSSCLTALIKSEREAEVRRAAVHVIALLLRGLSDKTPQILGDVLLDLYRALKWVVLSDSDDVTLLHAQLALEELDDVMRKLIFPAQKLEKKIVVLP